MSAAQGMGHSNLLFLREQIGCETYDGPITGSEIALLVELFDKLTKAADALADEASEAVNWLHSEDIQLHDVGNDLGAALVRYREARS